jgi:hypothetical protein
MPPTAIGRMKALVSAMLYARSTPWSWSGGVTSLMKVAPALMIFCALRPVVCLGISSMSLLEKMFCAMEMEMAPPSELKKMAIASGIGERQASQRRERRRGGIRERLTSSGHVFGGQHDLYGDEGDLNTGAGADAGEQLVSDPLPGVGRYVQGVDQACADREDRRAGPHEGGVVSDGGDGAADDDGGKRDADEIGDGADAGTLGGGALHGLEVEGEEEDVGVHAHYEKA